MWRYLLLGILIFAVILTIAFNQTEDLSATQIFSLPAVTDGDFKVAEKGLELDFPADHGAHPDYQTEWWYYTGNLESEDGRPFGFQLTFFRRAILPPSEREQRQSEWGTDQVYLAHFAISDIQGRNFFYQDRLGRGAAGLAGAEGEPDFRVWLENWTVEQIAENTYRLYAETEDFAISLSMVDLKGPIFQGEDGYSQKGPESENASMYYSMSRLISDGEIRIMDETYNVAGTAWMDHEFSTSALGKDQVGWDWFALQLENNYELMVYTIRDPEGNIDPFSRGILIDPQGNASHYTAGDFRIEVLSRWRSPYSDGDYPAEWEIALPQENLSLRVKPRLEDQELNLSYIYWEGTVAVEGTFKGERVTGLGYVELTGYAQSMQGQF